MLYWYLFVIVLVRMLSADIHVNVANNTSDEEKHCWNKRAEVEDLRRVELDRQLYGKR
jgi:1,4-dihydroxy-2-naphthoate octaprenyltransferase